MFSSYLMFLSIPIIYSTLSHQVGSMEGPFVSTPERATRSPPKRGTLWFQPDQCWNTKTTHPRMDVCGLNMVKS